MKRRSALATISHMSSQNTAVAIAAKTGRTTAGLSGVAAVLFLLAQQMGWMPNTAPPSDAAMEAVESLEKRLEDHLTDERDSRRALWNKLNGRTAPDDDGG